LGNELIIKDPNTP